MKFLVCGSRHINEATISTVVDTLNKLLAYGDIIIHGGATGIDAIVDSWAEKQFRLCIVIRPIHPTQKLSYLFRNAEMTGMCDRVIGFWDGKSRGTKFTLEYAKARGKPVEVVMI